MNNIAILGPGKFLDKSLRKNARALVRETIDRQWFKNEYKVANRNYIMMNTNGKLIGFALINQNHKNQRGDVRVQLIGTKQGMGYGRKLLQQIINNARNRGLKTVTLESVPEARGFYYKMGFVSIGIGNNMRYYINRRKSPSRPSPAPPSSSQASSARQSSPRQKPRL